MHNGACAKWPKYKRTCINQKSVCINETTNQPVDDKQCDQWARPICNGPTPMTCMWTLPANAELWNTNPPTNNTTNYTYSATQTLLACRYKCNSWYSYVNGKCSPNQCQWTIPDNAQLWNQILPSNNYTYFRYSTWATLNPCSYHCQSWYSYVNGKCSSIIPPTPEYQWACLTSCDGKIWNDTSAFDERTRRCGNISDSLSCANSRDNCRWDPDIGKCVASLNNSSLWICNSKEEKCVKKSCLSGGSWPLSSNCIDESWKQCKEQPHIQCEQPSPVDETINIKITCKQNKTNGFWNSTTYTADKPVPFDIFVGHEILIYYNNKLQTFQGNVFYNINSGQTWANKDRDLWCYAHVGWSYNNGTYDGSMLKMGESFISTKKMIPTCNKIENKSWTLNEISGGKKYIITLEDCA